MTKNKIVWLILVWACLMSSTINVSGQRKPITASEFYSAFSKAQQKSYGTSRKVETTDKVYSEGNLVKATTTIRETVLPDRSRYLFKEEIGGMLKELEIIKIGYDEYRRENSGEWTKRDLGGTGNGGGSGGGSGTNNFCRQFMVETTVLNNYSARLFEQMYIGSEQNGLTYQETKHWISDDGLPLKSEFQKDF